MANVKAEPGIKPDPDRATASPGALSDDDVYEDAGDLEFYDPSIPNDPYGSVYLTHLPKYLYDQWAQLNEDEELVIGKVRTWNEVDKKGQQKTRLAMLVDPKNPIHQTVPKEYNLELKDPDLLNTFMFTEQDLPGFKNKSQGGPNSNIPAHLRPRPERPKETPESKGVKKKPFYRKAIPKKTVLAGRFYQELNCQPVETAETKHILAMRASDALKPKATTSLMTGTRNPTGIIHAGTTAGNEKMRGFIRTVDPKAKSKAKAQKERAARMEEPVLRDAIFACFKQYSYWSMKSFKQRLNQPEAWLREVLEKVAILHKSGPFANNWQARPEYRQANVEDSLAPDVEVAGEDTDMDGEDDENIKMEDVI